MATVAILGPGGVGGFLAAALAHAGEHVTVVAREPTAETLAGRPMQLDSVRLGEITVSVPAQPVLEQPVDILFVATKATGLAAAVQRIAAEPGLVVPLLNGLDHLPLLREHFSRVCAATIRIESSSPEPGRVVQSSPFLRIDLAADDPVLAARLPEIARLLEHAQVPARIERSEAQAMWSKLVRLNALALTTSASDRQIGFIRADPEWRPTLEAAIDEGVAVARAEGAELDRSTPLGELLEAHEGLGSSMQRDIAAGHPPELDAIAGSVLRAGARHGLALPTVRRLASEVAARAGIDPPRTAPRDRPGRAR
jgi:2-dehydropantoate 2-reductase